MNYKLNLGDNFLYFYGKLNHKGSINLDNLINSYTINMDTFVPNQNYVQYNHSRFKSHFSNFDLKTYIYDYRWPINNQSIRTGYMELKNIEEEEN